MELHDLTLVGNDTGGALCEILLKPGHAELRVDDLTTATLEWIDDARTFSMENTRRD